MHIYGDVEEFLSKRDSLVKYSGSDRVVTNTEFWDIEDKKIPSEKVYESGIWSLDRLTEKFETGEVWIVSGPTKNGKTLLCDTIGYNMARRDGKVLWFSFELSPKKFLQKYKRDSGPTIYIPLTRKSGDLNWLKDRVIEAKLKYDCDIVFIDHLHFVADMVRLAKNSSLEIGHIMRFIKTEIALAENVLVFLISHITKTRPETLVDENDLRDSSFTAQEADGVIMVQRCLEDGKNPSDDKPFGNKAKVTVCNARRSGTMRERFKVIKDGDVLREFDIDDEKKEHQQTWTD